MAIQALETLKSIPHWICWKNEVRGDDDKPSKIPKNPYSGGNASSTNKDTWSSFMGAVRAKKLYSMDGLGWVFTEEVGIIGIDLDNCLDKDGKLANWAKKIVDSIHSYAEISPSGQGLHIFVRATIPKALGPTPGGRVEIYNKGRYFTMTGQILGSSEEIATNQAAVDSLWKAESERRRQKDRATKPVSTSSQLPQATLSSEKLKAYTEKAYLDEINTLALATEGCRNDTLNRAAFSLGQFIQAGLLDQSEIETTLLSIATQSGLSEREAWTTLQSGLKAGMNNPRDNWPDDNPSPEQPAQSEAKPPTLPRNDLTYHKAVEPHLGTIQDRWGISPETVELFKVGYCEACPTSTYSASYTLPYYQSGDLLDIRHRLLSPNGQGVYRPETEGLPPHIFNIEAAQEDDFVLLVNREPGAMLLYGEYGLPVVGLPSTFRKEWVAEFDGLKRVFIALDPGQEVAARNIARLMAHRGLDARVCSLPFSPRDMLVKYGCSLGEFIRFIEQGWKV